MVTEYKRNIHGVVSFDVREGRCVGKRTSSIMNYLGVVRHFNLPLSPSPNKQNDDYIKAKILRFMEKIVLPKMERACKITVTMGSMLERRMADAEPQGVYFYPDHNSSILK